jgi:hypothetical protein
MWDSADVVKWALVMLLAEHEETLTSSLAAEAEPIPLGYGRSKALPHLDCL